MGRLLIGVEHPASGTVTFDGEDLGTVSPKRWTQLRASMQMIFQNATASFNPRMTIGDHLREAVFLQRRIQPGKATMPVDMALAHVGLSPMTLGRFPFELSGGQMQRAAIARALLCRPRFIVCDEIVSALDLSVQAQILNLLAEIQAELAIALLFISHDLAVVRHVSHRAAVMYFGKVVETGGRDAVFNAPRHPYTAALLASGLSMDPADPPPARLAGAPPNPVDLPKGCRFHPRCPVADDRCRSVEPGLTGEAGHQTACHHPLEGGQLA